MLLHLEFLHYPATLLLAMAKVEQVESSWFWDWDAKLAAKSQVHWGGDVCCEIWRHHCRIVIRYCQYCDIREMTRFSMMRSWSCLYFGS